MCWINAFFWCGFGFLFVVCSEELVKEQVLVAKILDFFEVFLL